MQHYLPCIRKAVEFIEDNIDSLITINQVSQAAGYSEYHFQRVFSGAVGEPLREYIRSRKLTNAAKQLVASPVPILEISLQAGFESQEAFSGPLKKCMIAVPGHTAKRGNNPIFMAEKNLMNQCFASCWASFLSNKRM